MVVEWKSGFETAVDDCESKLEKDARSNVWAIEEPNDSERFISGSEETVRRWLGAVLGTKFAMSRRMQEVCRS
jgi:hypothetical protein